MKVLSAREAARVKVVEGRGRSSKNDAVYAALRTLEKEQALQLASNEWMIKTPPAMIVNSLSKTVGFRVRRLSDESGWLITRTK